MSLDAVARLMFCRIFFFPYIITTVRHHCLPIGGEWGSKGVSKGEEEMCERSALCVAAMRKERNTFAFISFFLLQSV